MSRISPMTQVIVEAITVRVRLGRVAPLLVVGLAIRVDDGFPGLKTVGEPVPVGNSKGIKA